MCLLIIAQFFLDRDSVWSFWLESKML